MRKSLLWLAVVLVAAAIPASAIEKGFYIGGSIGGSSLEVRDFDDELGDLRFSGSGTDAAYGIGIALRLGKAALRAEGEQFKVADAEEVYMFSVGATFTF